MVLCPVSSLLYPHLNEVSVLLTLQSTESVTFLFLLLVMDRPSLTVDVFTWQRLGEATMTALGI
jgi:hypothetical protein